MKKTLIMLLALILGAGFIFSNDISITGSTTVFPIAQMTAEMYMEINPDINISVRGGGSGVGIAALMNGQTNIANASRPIKTKELKIARENGVDPFEIIIAMDGIAIIINPSNKIPNLTFEQLKNIYNGKIINWKELGGKSAPIVVISRDYSSGTFEVFKTLVLEGDKVRDDALLLASNKAVVTTVANTPGAIGYIGFGFLSDKVKAVSVGNVMPSEETVNNGTYKLARALYMYTNGKPKGEIKDYLDYVLSEQGQQIVEKVGYISLQ